MALDMSSPAAASGFDHVAMTRRIFVDTEWTSLPWSGQSELMWIGLADGEGRSWTAISADVEIDSFHQRLHRRRLEVHQARRSALDIY